MKYIAIFLIVLYQSFISPLMHILLGQKTICRYSPSCSEFAREQIAKKGLVRGGYTSFRRLLSCQPFVKYSSNKV